MWLYGFGRGLISLLYRRLWRIRVEGLENIPREGGVIVCANHVNGNDPFFVGISVNRPVQFMAKEEIFKVPVVGFLARGVGAFPVKRGHADRASLKHAQEILQAGGCFGIFPEGTRVRTGKLGKAAPGTAYLALKAGVPVIPLGISSSYKLFSPVILKFGKPVDLSAFEGVRLTSEVLDAAGEQFMTAIGAQLVPPVTPEAS